eukprot:CAMPEP_0172772780 /NCGR_PEP_ID=MMETSP1074-20121228/193003_1 /TAXON_ID=2916 /ORGANISM="Ceratium fusus, Strain PA161109" /LENGTH=56 /DNA_ID=CAMNT_0013608951 /DNA_START=118 /DNA_END=285 /DNA_ORIENTATION=+
MSKVHMLSGRILEAAQILAEVDDGVLNGDCKAVIDRAQILVVAGHSSPTPDNMEQL